MPPSGPSRRRRSAAASTAVQPAQTARWAATPDRTPEWWPGTSVPAALVASRRSPPVARACNVEGRPLQVAAAAPASTIRPGAYGGRIPRRRPIIMRAILPLTGGSMLKPTAGDPMDGLKNRRSIIASCVLALLAVAVVAPASIVFGLTAHQLLVAAAVGLGGAALLFAFLLAFRTRPYARTAAPCPGETVTRHARQGAVRETIVLDRAFNSMSSSLRETREELGRLVDEQTALRRVAMLIAHGEAPSVVFNSVCEEVGGVLGADVVRMLRYEADEATTVIGAWGAPDELLPLDTCWTITGNNIPSMVLHACAPARMDCFIGAVSPLCVYLRQHGIRSGVGTPITVDGRCWGVMTAFSTQNLLLPPDAETRICDFTDLASTAIVNAHTRADLIASRARIVAATDQARRQIERDLHDGTQQRLVSLSMDLRTLEQRMPTSVPTALRSRLTEIGDGLSEAVDELRETARGIHPGNVTKLGLVPAIRGLAYNAAVPVTFDAGFEMRLPDSVEVAAYYVVAESLTNAVKHARATAVSVEANIADGRLRLLVRDDGQGGADPSLGSGLTGLADRIAALNGTIDIVSPPGHGTRLEVTLPL